MKKKSQLKAYIAFAGESPWDYGCQLIFAKTAGQARSMAWSSCPLLDTPDYISFRALRRKNWDKYTNELEKETIFESNEELPGHWDKFYTEEDEL